MTASEDVPVIPEHIDPDLVLYLPIGRGVSTERLPHEIAAEIHRDFPRGFYAPNLMNGGGWVFPRVEDQRKIWLDTEHFSSQVIQPFAAMAGGDWNMTPTHPISQTSQSAVYAKSVGTAERQDSRLRAPRHSEIR